MMSFAVDPAFGGDGAAGVCGVPSEVLNPAKRVERSDGVRSAGGAMLADLLLGVLNREVRGQVDAEVVAAGSKRGPASRAGPDAAATISRTASISQVDAVLAREAGLLRLADLSAGMGTTPP